MKNAKANLNKWQKHYLNIYYDGKMPRDKSGKVSLELLGYVNEQVTVHLPEAGVKTYKVTLDENDMPNGIIGVRVLSSNLLLWACRGYKIEF